MARINKEKAGLTVRFSIRLPKHLHKWLKEESEAKKTSMNDLIIDAIEEKIMCKKSI